MTFPVVSDSAAGLSSSDSTSHSVALPATVAAGDILLAFFSNDGTATVTWDNATAGAWTLGHSDVRTTLNRLTVYWRRADGTEGGKTLTITTSAAEQAVFRVVAVSGAHESTNPAFGTAANATSANPNPPLLTPSWGAENTLWFAYHGNDDGRRSQSAIPANYANGFYDSSNGPSGCGLGTARRELNATSDDPGTFTISASQGWVSNTVAIRPAPTGIVATLSGTLGAATVSATASAPVTADASPTLGAASVSSAATVPAIATLAATLGAATVSATAVQGQESEADLAVTLGAATVAADASAPITAQASPTLGAATLASTVAAPIAASGTAALGAATLAATAKADAAAALAATLGQATASATASAPVSANLSATLAPAALSATAGSPAVIGTLERTLGAATVAAAGTVATPSATASLAATLGAATTGATVSVHVTVTGAATLGAASLASSVDVLAQAVTVITLDAATLDAQGSDATIARMVNGEARPVGTHTRPAPHAAERMTQAGQTRPDTTNRTRNGPPSNHRPR